MNKELHNETLNIEINLLLEAIYQRYGFDFRNYSKAHLKRRLLHRLGLSGLNNISEMQGKLLHEENFIHTLLSDLSITVTEMFRDPEFYKSVRNHVFPSLKTYPFFRIWHAGCSTGEEVYSMAIMLMEEGLYNRAQIYATDFNHKALQVAKTGVYSAEHCKEYGNNYQKAGGKKDFSDYYASTYNSIILDNDLKRNIVFAEHNLVIDSDFTEVNLIVCRNVLIYFNSKLQNEVHLLFLKSLIKGGFLCLGSKESIQFSKSASFFTAVDANQKIYQKKYAVSD
ncbi:MAG: protein-glutamate O-methyltransferase CheR [Lentimicrobiaceae bacterium]|nr:protein-glutamate O-methyltransferase CheR [Lentimicrobiaceae bacterium]